MNSARDVPSPDIVLVHCPNRPLRTPTMYFSLGILYLAACLERDGFKVAICDLRDKEVDINLIPEANCIGVSFTTGESADAKKIAMLAKKRDPYCVTAAGGAHPSLMPEDVEDYFDAVVMGEGENAISGIADGDFAGLARQPRIEDLDSIPFPAWHLVPPDRLFSEALWFGEKYGQGPRATTVMASRGCPMNCHFCGQYMRLPVVFRSPENVAEEIRRLRDEYSVFHFRFEDDNMTLKKEWLFELCRLLKPLGCNFKGHSRSDLIDKESVAALKSCGFEELGLGVESADDRVLALANKKETREDHIKAVKVINNAGLRCRLYFVCSLPGQTWETIEINKRFMREIGRGADDQIKWTCSIFSPYPGCEFYKNSAKYGIRILDKEFDHYWNFPDCNLIALDGIPKKELDSQYKHFYNWLRSDSWRK